jgi:cellulose synthase/poly-beta-1,6-N-acetylglucosamine synthase-like glycosyltransferase
MYWFISYPSIIAGLYYFALSCLFIYGLHRIWLLFCVYRKNKELALISDILPPADLDLKVTVQLPIYNERFVAARLMDSVAQFDWPSDRLEIQVLDDSTDDTTKIIDSRAAYWSKKGISIKVLRRGDRNGFKAGALSEGLRYARGDFIAVFDADFLPSSDFLTRTMPCFADPHVGMVQGRWGFLNTGHNWFTRIQALLLAPHFEIEHYVRFRRGLFFNFNGTAGIWRKKAIESSGNWQSDTVTEDLDLSYRAQLKGWRFIYLNDLIVPSELPVTLGGFRTQQQRWAKGSIQSAKKILPVLLSKSFSLEQKLESAFHLLANVGWLFGTIITLTLYPVICWRVDTGPYQLLRLDIPLFLGSSGAIMLYFLYYAVSRRKENLYTGLILLPVMAIGMAPSIALSVLAGFIKKGGYFTRTPKFGRLEKGDIPITVLQYYNKDIFFIFLNLFFLIYTLLPLMLSAHRGTWIAAPFLAIFPLGFILVLVKELRETICASKISVKRTN